MTSSWNVILLRLALRNHCILVFCMAFKKSFCLQSSAFIFYAMCIERVLGPAGNHAASCELKPVDVLTID